MTMLDVQHLTKHFANQKAIDDISFQIPQGSIFGLLGPNGAGKTTLIRMITGIFYPDSGQITVEGKLVNPTDQAANIGYMPEERGLYKKMKIGDQALYLAQLKGLSKQDALKAIKYWFQKLEMETWWNKKVEDLSKGMQQKLQFVITVLHNPKLIILDEPFSGLDPLNATLLKDEIYSLAANGATIIFSTHRMEQVEEICDQIILINQGKKILDGTVAETRQYYKEHIFELEHEPTDLLANGPLFDVISQNGNTTRLRKFETVSNNQLLRHLLDQNITIHGFREILPGLNEIFIKLVEGTPAARAFEKN